MIKKKRQIPEFDRGYERGYKKGLAQGQLEGFEFHAVCMLYVLKDKFKETDNKLMLLHESVMEYVKMISKGYIQYDRLKKALGDSFNFEFVWRD